jgi:3-phenylpropionate/trans-cinnamate dioxygenase ferredoxin subunit
MISINNVILGMISLLTPGVNAVCELEAVALTSFFTATTNTLQFASPSRSPFLNPNKAAMLELNYQEGGYAMQYVKAAQTDQIRNGGKLKVRLNHKDILLTMIDDAYYAIDNTCSHMGGSLYDGKLEGDHAVCPKHGSVFDVRTGKVVKPGKILMISVGVEDLRSYPVKVEGSDILIGLD